MHRKNKRCNYSLPEYYKDMIYNLTSTETQFSGQSMPLEEWCATGSVSFPDLTFSVCCTAVLQCPQYLLCQQRILHDHPPAGLVSRARSLVSISGQYKLQILLKKKSEGHMKTIDDLFAICKQLCASIQILSRVRHEMLRRGVCQDHSI